MNFRRNAIATGGTAAAVILFTLAAPRATHALTAALVQVTNSAAAPAITQDVSKLASQNVQLLCVGNVDCAQILPDGSSSANYVVPGGHSLIITTAQLNTPSMLSSVQLMQGSSSSVRESWTLGAGGSFLFQYPSGIVISAGSTLFVNNQIDRTYLNGYVVSN